MEPLMDIEIALH